MLLVVLLVSIRVLPLVCVCVVNAIATSTQLYSFTLQLKLRLKTQLLLKCAKHIHILIYRSTPYTHNTQPNDRARQANYAVATLSLKLLSPIQNTNHYEQNNTRHNSKLLWYSHHTYVSHFIDTKHAHTKTQDNTKPRHKYSSTN